MKNIKWRYSIETKLVLGFGIAIIMLLLSSLFIYYKAAILARQTTYEKMYSQTNYYLQTLDKEIDHVRQLQMDFLNDRKLAFLIIPDMNISDYEKREGLLSVMERMYTITGGSNLIHEGLLFLPKSGYLITSSGVNRIYQPDREQMEKYIQYADGTIHFDGENFFIVETGVPKIQSDYLPNHMLVISFSSKEIKNNLSALNTGENSGAFIYNEQLDTMLEHSNGASVGREIWRQLEKDSDGSYLSAQRITIGKEHYLVFVGGSGTLGFVVQYAEESAIMESINQFRNMVYILLSVMALMALLFVLYTKRLIHKPIETMLKAFQRVQEGNWKEYIIHKRKDEFSYLYEGFNEMENQMGELIEQVYVQTNLAQRAQLKQLQAQIAPHFLYNSFFILSRKITRQDYDNAEELANHLGTYFQYLTRNESDYVFLQQEAEHARSYAVIQGTRFVTRITITFQETPENFCRLMVPRLILQPLLENAFEYGLENKMQDGILLVHFEETEEEYRIYVEDNGEDISDEKIEELGDAIANGKDGEITGIFNIHKRLQIYYKQQAGLRVERSGIGGVCIMIYIRKEGIE